MYGVQSLDLVSGITFFVLLPLEVLLWDHPALDLTEDGHQFARRPLDVGHGLLQEVQRVKLAQVVRRVLLLDQQPRGLEGEG